MKKNILVLMELEEQLIMEILMGKNFLNLAWQQVHILKI